MINAFYRLMYLTYRHVYGEQQMLHYPLYKKEAQNLIEGQTYFTDYCIGRLPTITGKRLLEIGCGNGVQMLHIRDVHLPDHAYGVDLYQKHVEIAQTETMRRRLSGIAFGCDDAQRLNTVDDESFDIAICTESAHHYPDKTAFLTQVRRVLRPGGLLLVADLLRRAYREPSWFERQWSLFYWSLKHYRIAFEKLGFETILEEDLTDKLLCGFGTSRHWFPNGERRKGPGYYIGRALGQTLIRLYAHQLSTSLEYHLFIVKKTPLQSIPATRAE